MNFEQRANSVFLTPDISKVGIPAATPTLPDADPAEHHRKHTFACFKDLREDFNRAGICEERVWDFLKSENGVDSRAKLSPIQWVKIAARLQACREDAEMLKIFLSEIPCEFYRIHVYADNPTCAIGRPRNIERHHISEEWGDFQKISNYLRCGLRVEQGKKTSYFSPHRSVTPAKPTEDRQETTEARIATPVVSLETNAHGQVLSMFGDVLEVRSC